MAEQLDNNELDKVKLLWKKYGSKLVTLICVILILIIAWQYWQKRKLENNVQAAELYQNLALIADNASSNSEAILNQAQNLISLYPKSIYADFARLEIAKQSVLKNQLDQAAASLKQVADNTLNPNLQAIAKLRLARVELAQNKTTDAIATLNSITLAGFALSSNMLLGDAYFANKDYAKAKTYWQSALSQADKPELASIKSLLQMKIDNLAALSK
ncbi:MULTISPECIES: YfgM family protein [Cysteiniphilum]|uniref:Ancillary SecYEG translocon subunit n=1 Tax=Cysteiniphilum litorale TaxID=2056700 RepID=A0A8J2Z4U1_9GAMM|nr:MULTISPECIES: tetratricopeptide repeat protein [Cysteiniphilum]GGF98403.1 membrane protein [Cysteiniphilum litorale]